MNRAEAESLTDPREMRKELIRVSYTGGSLLDDDPRRFPGAGSALLRNIRNMAEAQGLSGEDFYTCMAWHLALSCQRMEGQLLEFLISQPPRSSLARSPGSNEMNSMKQTP